jgi:hypothetical protein
MVRTTVMKRRRTMKTLSCLPAALVLAVVSHALPVEAKKVNPTKMTCEEFLALGESIQPRAVAYLDGYSKRGKLKEEDVAEVDVDRQMAVLVVACKEDPKKTLWDKVRAHLPGGKKVKPTKMVCQDYVAMDETDRPELVYWASGYHKGVKETDAGEVDLESDVAVVYEECKAAPKESFWSKVKKHL